MDKRDTEEGKGSLHRVTVSRRRFLLGAAGVAGAGLLAACGSTPSAPAPAPTTGAAAPAAPAAPAATAASGAAAPAVPAAFGAYKPLKTYPSGTTINVLVSASHGQFGPLWSLLPDWQNLTGIKVNLTQVPTSDLRQKIMQDLQLGTGTYDQIEFPDDTFGPAQQYMAPLEPFFQSEGIDLEKWKKDQVPWSVQAVTFDGKMKYHPFYSGCNGVAYRESLLKDPKEQADFKQKFGYDLPLPPKSMKEFIDLAKHFTRPNLWGLVFPGQGETAQNVMEAFTFLNGVTYVDEQNHSLWGPKHPENKPKVSEAAKYMQDFIYTHKVAPPEVTGMTSTETTAFYQSGKAAMVMDVIYLGWNDYRKPNVQQVIGNSGSFKIPALTPGSGTMPFYWSRGITQSSKNKEASWELLRWLMHPDSLKLALQKGTGVFVPTSMPLLDWAASSSIVPQGVADAVKEATFYRLNAAVPQARTVVRKYTEQITLSKITPDQYTEQCGNDIENLMVQAGLVK